VELAESVRAAPTCRLTENGSKLAADQPERRVSTDGREALSGGLGLPLATPAVRVIVPMPATRDRPGVALACNPVRLA